MKYEKIWSTTIYTAGDEGYDNFRIPTMITLPNGRVLAFAEGRSAMSDAGEINIVLRISDDGGHTFGPLKVIVAGGGNTAGNPCPVYDRTTGKILLMFNRNTAAGHEGLILQGKAPRTVHMTESSDNGETWAPERDITVQTKMPFWTWHAMGPCHAIQLKSGRIVVPCNHAVLDPETAKSGPYRSHTLYSDDHGQTWKIGRDVADTTNECTVTELKDGRVLINMRMHPIQTCRSLAVSLDGGDSFGQFRFVEAMPGPGCEVSMLTVEHGDAEYVLVSNPSHPTNRELLIIHESADGGDTWQDGYVVTEGPAAYSDLTQLDENHIAVVYEAGTNHPYERIEFSIIKIQM